MLLCCGDLIDPYLCGLFPVYPEEFLPTYQTINQEAALAKPRLVSLDHDHDHNRTPPVALGEGSDSCQQHLDDGAPSEFPL